MLGLFRVVLQPVMHGWDLAVQRDLGFMPRPDDDPRTHAHGIDSDRVLVFGAGAAVGWGVRSHDLALPGNLARALSSGTGRGTDVDVLADPSLTAANAVRELADVNLTRYDAIVISLGLAEVTRLASTRSWRRDLDRLLDHLGVVSPGTRIFVLGIHVPTRLTAYDPLVSPVLSAQRAALNRASAQLSARENRATFVPQSSARSGGTNRYRSADDYRRAARTLAAAMAPELTRRFNRIGASPERDRRVSGEDEAARQRAVDALGILDTPPEERFDRLVALAQRTFGTSAAALTIIDRDRQWQKSCVGAPYDQVDRGDSICSETIKRADGLVSSDVTKDERLNSTRLVNGKPPVRFYAGFPIEAPGGERIGALCVFDPQARDASRVDRSLLRELALMLQREVWMRAAA